MSENQEFEMSQGMDPRLILPGHEGRSEVKNLHEISESIDAQSYFLGEVPQAHLVDPCAVLPLNSDRLVGSINMIEKLLFEIGVLIEEEVCSIQKHQKRIVFWEDRIEKNKGIVKKNDFRIKQNNTDAFYDKKNRDYWFGRAEEVETDYSHAEVASRQQDWAWLIKKYGLKNPDGSEIDSKGKCVEELCNGEIKDLAAGYRLTGSKYEIARKEKETEISRLVKENAQLLSSNETLQGYISSVYTNEIEPLQDGVLLLKELGLKLKTLGANEQSSFGDLRQWAEPFLSEFIRSNSRVPQAIVTHFRRLTSIPLPPEYC